MQWLKPLVPFSPLNVIFEQSSNPESATYLLLEKTNLLITVKNVSAQLDGCAHSSLLHQFRLCKNVPHSRLPDKLILSLCPRLCGLDLLSEYNDIHHKQKPHCMIVKLNNLTLSLPNNKKCISFAHRCGITPQLPSCPTLYLSKAWEDWWGRISVNILHLLACLLPV